MTMHSPKHRDTRIRLAQPITLIAPLVEEALRLAGVHPNRDLVIDRFMNAVPRIAVIRGSEDHPPSLGSKEMARRFIRQIWACGAIPFEVVQSFPCEELSRGTLSAHYGLLSRNSCTATMASHVEMHGYDAAMVIGVCDKMMIGNLRAFIEVDQSRQKQRQKPVFAMLIPSLIGRDVYLTDDEKRRFEPLRARLSASERAGLEDFLQRPQKPQVYSLIKAFLDRCFHRRLIGEAEKDDLEHCVAKCTANPGANCGASETSMVSRLMLASLGLVPRHMDIQIKAPTEEASGEVVRRLIRAVQKRERRMGVSSLCRLNLVNACAVWSATGGHSGWFLHLGYLANALGRKLPMKDIMRHVPLVPRILAVGESAGRTAFAMAEETESGGNSGIDTVMRTLAEKRLIQDHAATFDGSWMHRIMEARSANGKFLHSTITPHAPTCGVTTVRGNVCSAALARAGHDLSQPGRFEKKICLAVCYLGIQEFQADVLREGVLDRLKRRIDRDDLYHTWRFNIGSGDSGNPSAAQLAEWSKDRLWEYMVRAQLLRIAVVVAGVGPHAAGMPEIHIDPKGSDVASMVMVLTDGRVTHGHVGASIEHVVPEAFDGGAIGAVRTGDWIYVDFAANSFQVVRPNGRNGGCKSVSAKELLGRPELKKRVHDLALWRTQLLPSFVTVLNQLTSAESGVSPNGG